MAGPKPILMNGMASNQGIWDETTDANHVVGTRAALPDGRVYYYARNSSTAIVAGQLLTMEVQTAQFTGLAVNTAAAGDTTLSITLGTTAVTAQEYAEGYVVVIDDTGEGITYKIREHPAVSATTAGVFTLYDEIDVAFAAATTVQLLKNPWADVVIAPSGTGHIAAGVSNTAVTLGTAAVPYYFWCQTWGMTACWQDAATAVGAPLQSGTTAGQVEIQAEGAGALGNNVGINVFTAVATEYQPIFLQIAP